MVEISAEEILELHNSVVDRFKIVNGVLNQSSLDAISKRPELKIGGEYVYKTPFTRAASILEGIIRWHPFADGNKRTALLATVYYLKLENYGVAVPLSAVRHTVKIAKNKKNDEKSTRRLINEIANWLENHAGHNQEELNKKISMHIIIPYRFLGLLVRAHLTKLAKWRVDRWLALDIYPEYEKESSEIFDFINATVEASMNVFKDDDSIPKLIEINALCSGDDGTGLAPHTVKLSLEGMSLEQIDLSNKKCPTCGKIGTLQVIR